MFEGNPQGIFESELNVNNSYNTPQYIVINGYIQAIVDGDEANAT